MAIKTFKELVDEVYLPQGETSYSARVLIHRETGRNVSMSTLRAAYFGTRVEVESAKKLMLWAGEKHPRILLNFDSLISAPPASKRRDSWRTWTKTAPAEPGEYRVRGRLANPVAPPLKTPTFAVVWGQLGVGLVAELHYSGYGYRIVLDERGAGDELEWSGPIPPPAEP
jgi:hypothetical protein